MGRRSKKKKGPNSVREEVIGPDRVSPENLSG